MCTMLCEGCCVTGLEVPIYQSSTWDYYFFVPCHRAWEISRLRMKVGYFMMLVARVMRWAGHVALMGERRGVYRVLVGKPEGK